MKLVKAILFIIPTLFMAATMLFVPEIADATSIAYVALIGVFLGIDMVAMVKKTKVLPGAEYDKLKLWRYIIVAVGLAGLLAVAFIQYKTSKIMMVTIGAFATAVYLIAGILIAGLDGNKIATEDKGPEDREHE